MGIGRLRIEDINKKRVALEKDIVLLLNEELKLLDRKKDLYKEYYELMASTTNAYPHSDLSVWLNLLPPSPRI